MKILIFSAHPDDAEFVMGGTMLKLAENHEIVNVILTRGEAGTYGDPKTREREGQEAGKRGGYRVRFLDFIDNHVEDTVENAKKLALVIREECPHTIFSTYHTNNGTHTDGSAHPDHCALGRLVKAAARIAKFKNADVDGEAHCATRIIYYMVPRYTKPTFIVDVTDVADRLPEFWRAHTSQTQLRDGAIIDYLLSWRKALGSELRIGYGEAFITDEPLLMPLDAYFP